MIEVQNRVKNIFFLFQVKVRCSDSCSEPLSFIFLFRQFRIHLAFAPAAKASEIPTSLSEAVKTQFWLHPGGPVLDPSISQSIAFTLQAHLFLPNIDPLRIITLVLLCWISFCPQIQGLKVTRNQQDKNSILTEGLR